ncbi:hypothetical protein AQUCO_00200687v1 [Aquilegia coerulea]|uniref:Uncharacterized protein n=1 Tax=Aquilegia coerulea TaxID=218851 RepID=A0A2G5F4N3_AQUCA|nr:hypothetical protein AQUCO_00200687v1 [Aquilegia coerulea]
MTSVFPHPNTPSNFLSIYIIHCFLNNCFSFFFLSNFFTTTCTNNSFTLFFFFFLSDIFFLISCKVTVISFRPTSTCTSFKPTSTGTSFKLTSIGTSFCSPTQITLITKSTKMLIQPVWSTVPSSKQVSTSESVNISNLKPSSK